MTDMAVSIVKNQLIPLARDELKRISNVDKEIQELRSHFKTIQEVLKNAEERQGEDHVNLWLADVKSVSYDVNDVLDEWRTKILRRQQVQDQNQDQDHKLSCPLGCLSFIQPMLSKIFLSFPWDECCDRYWIGHEIEPIKKRIAKVLEEAKLATKQSSIEEAEGTGTSHQINIKFLKEQSLPLNNQASEFFAREVDKEIIKTKLEDRNQESIISITGIDGVGKTTLAQHVFDDPKVKSHFETMIWVKVPKPFNPAKLPQCTKILQTPNKDKELSDVEDLQSHVSGKLVLLVLDDAREDYDNDSWSDLTSAFKEAADGSKLLITSHREGFAYEMNVGQVYKHKLENLPSPQVSWPLLKSIALRNKAENLENEVEDIGKEIVENLCNGFPLAIKAVGKLLLNRNTKRGWEIVLASDRWKSQGVEKEVYPALRTCYSELPHYLKACFAYCAIFQEAERIYTDELVKLWMAQGLVPNSSEKPDPELEATGEDCVSTLENLSFFQDVEKDEDEKTISFRMHNTIHEFSRHITNQEFAIGNIDASKDFIYAIYFERYHLLRHLTLLCDDAEAQVFPSSIYRAKRLRTLRVQPIAWRSKLRTAPLADIFSRLTRLRALDLRKSDIEELPDEVKELIHLRYLNLSQTKLRKLPETVCTLYNLQTLGLNECEELVELPQQMGDMKKLRHLEIFRTDKLSFLPQGIGRLTSLRTLSKFIVSGDDRSGCKIGELRKLDSVDGCLEIQGIERVANREEAKEAEMQNKRYLRELKLKLGGNGLTDEKEEEKRLEGVIEGLQPHPNLQTLEIWNYPGTSFPNIWKTTRGTDDDEGSAAKLKVLRLSKFHKCTQLSPIGKLKDLRQLEIVEMEEVVSLYLELPHLLFLKLQHCPRLMGLQLNCHRELKKLVICECNKLERTTLPRSSSSSSPSSCQLPLELPELEHLSLYGDAGVLTKSLSSTHIHLPNLKYLLVSGSEHSSLPQGLGQFTELQSLEIEFCDKIHSLPEELQNLHKLQELRVNDCGNLGSRCQKEDWCKISHIPKIIIDYKKIKRPRNLRAKGLAIKKKVFDIVRTYHPSNFSALLDGFEETLL